MNKYVAFLIVVCFANTPLLAQDGAHVRLPGPRKQPAHVFEKKPSVTEVDGRSLQQWVDMLFDSSEKNRTNAIKVIPRFGAKAFSYFVSRSEVARRSSRQAGELRVMATALKSVVANPHGEAREWVALLPESSIKNEGPVRLLYPLSIALRPYGNEAFDALDEIMDHEHSEVRRVAILLMKDVSLNTQQIPKLVPKLVEIMKTDQGEWVRTTAIGAIGELYQFLMIRTRLAYEPLPPAPEPDAVTRAAMASLQSAIPELVDIVKKGETPGDRIRATQAIAEFRIPQDEAKVFLKDAVNALRVAMRTDTDGGVRRWAADALANLGAPAISSIPDLVEALQTEEDDGIRHSAVRAIGHIGPPAQEVIPTLVNALRHDRSIYVRRSAAEALGTLGKADENVVSSLVEALQKDDDDSVRSSSAAALGNLGAENQISILTKALETDENIHVRESAAKALGALGAAAESAIPALQKAATADMFEGVQHEANEALAASASIAEVPTIIDWQTVAKNGADGIVAHLDNAFGQPRVSNHQDAVDHEYGFIANARAYGQIRRYGYRADREKYFFHDLSVHREAMLSSDTFGGFEAIPLNSIFFKIWVPRRSSLSSVEGIVLGILGFKGRLQEQLSLRFEPDGRTRGSWLRGHKHRLVPVHLRWMKAETTLQDILTRPNEVTMPPAKVKRLPRSTSLRRLSVVENASDGVDYVKPHAIRLGPEWLHFRALFDATHVPTVPKDWVQIEACISCTRSSMSMGREPRLWWKNMLP